MLMMPPPPPPPPTHSKPHETLTMWLSDDQAGHGWEIGVCGHLQCAGQEWGSFHGHCSLTMTLTWMRDGVRGRKQCARQDWGSFHWHGSWTMKQDTGARQSMALGRNAGHFMDTARWQWSRMQMRDGVSGALQECGSFHGHSSLTMKQDADERWSQWR